MARPGGDQWHSINQNKAVQAALKKRAEVIAQRATAISRAAGGKATYSIRTGIRPGGRAFADVVSSDPEEEAGTETTPRINALRRAARGER